MHLSEFYIKQSTLKTRDADKTTFSNYYLQKNQQIIAALQSISNKITQAEIIYLYGQYNRVGRSHLSQAACHYAQELGLRSIYLPLKELINFTPDILLNLESLALVCIDDIQCLQNNLEWEEAFLYAYQRILAHNGRLIITANVSPKFLNCTIPDLHSRLIEAVSYQLDQLNDEDKLSILLKHAAARGIFLPTSIGRFILTRSNRHLTTIINALNLLESESLSRKRKITIPLIKEILQLT